MSSKTTAFLLLKDGEFLRKSFEKEFCRAEEGGGVLPCYQNEEEACCRVTMVTQQAGGGA